MKSTVKNIISINASILIFILVFFGYSCSREELVQQHILSHSPFANHSPVANAGPDQMIWLPNNSVILDGSGSFDQEYNITSYTWTKISGPSVFTVANANAAKSQLTDLMQGVYQFELKVSDHGGLFSKDTVNIEVIGPTMSGDNPLMIDNLVWEFDNISKMYFMRSPTLSASQISHINEVDLLYADLPPFGGYLWQPIEKDGTTPGIFYYKVDANSVVAYIYCDGGCDWWMQYVMPQMAIYFN